MQKIAQFKKKQVQQEMTENHAMQEDSVQIKPVVKAVHQRSASNKEGMKQKAKDHLNTLDHFNIG